MVVTSTTVGYGDFSPVTSAGRLFTCVYAFIGTTEIITIVSPHLARILGMIGKLLAPLVPKLVDLSDTTLTLNEINSKISYPRRYLRAALGPIAIMLALVGFRLSAGDNVVDAIYFSVVTCTTVGYGDMAPASRLERCVAMVGLPLVVTALTEMLAEFNRIGIRRRIREDSALAVTLDKRNGDKVLTELEFLTEAMLEYDLVDEVIDPRNPISDPRPSPTLAPS